MPAGIKTPQNIRDEFRALYLVGGSIPQAARDIGIPERTAYDLGWELEKEESFTKDRRLLQAQALERAISRRERMAEISMDRFENGSVDEQEFGDNVTIVDKRPDYGRLIVDAEKNAHHLAKIQEAPQLATGSINITFAPPDSSEEESDTADD